MSPPRDPADESLNGYEGALESVSFRLSWKRAFQLMIEVDFVAYFGESRVFRRSPCEHHDQNKLQKSTVSKICSSLAISIVNFKSTLRDSLFSGTHIASG